MPVIYNTQSPLSQAVFGISRIMHMCSIISHFFRPQQTKEDCFMFIIVKLSLCNLTFYNIK